jgi:hypothetical protein
MLDDPDVRHDAARETEGPTSMEDFSKLTLDQIRSRQETAAKEFVRRAAPAIIAARDAEARLCGRWREATDARQTIELLPGGSLVYVYGKSPRWRLADDGSRVVLEVTMLVPTGDDWRSSDDEECVEEIRGDVVTLADARLAIVVHELGHPIAVYVRDDRSPTP